MNARLLDLASRGGPLHGCTSDVVLFEAYRHAVGGTFNVRFEEATVLDFFEAHQPLLEIGAAPISRRLPADPALHNLPIGEIVYNLTGRKRDDMLDGLAEQITLPEFDELDLHVVAAAYGMDAELICTNDKIFLRGSLGSIGVSRPGPLAREYGID